MTLDRFIENLIKIRDADPTNGKLAVVTSIDDEGNGFNYVHYTPALGLMDGDREFQASDDVTKINAICVN